MCSLAETVLSSLSLACVPDRNDAIIGALELKPFAELPGASADVRDAFAALQRVAEGGTLILDHAYRRRMAKFADMIRAFREEQERLSRLASGE